MTGFTVKDKGANILGKNIIGQLREGRCRQMAVDGWMEQLGFAQLAKIPSYTAL